MGLLRRDFDDVQMQANVSNRMLEARIVTLEKQVQEAQHACEQSDLRATDAESKLRSVKASLYDCEFEKQGLAVQLNRCQGTVALQEGRIKVRVPPCDNSVREKDWRCRKRGTQAT
jgi:hypothetical protein